MIENEPTGTSPGSVVSYRNWPVVAAIIGMIALVSMLWFVNQVSAARIVTQPVAAAKPVNKTATNTVPVKPTPPIKKYQGLATWYRHEGGLTAASTQFKKGTKLRVVAVRSGKTVDVVVDDYGPSKDSGIALDLDSTAFKKIAPLGAGKIKIEYYKI